MPSSLPSITIRGKRINRGDILQRVLPTSRFPKKVTVGAICKKGSGLHIGLVSDRPRDGWHDLDGHCKSNCGYWVEPRELTKYYAVVKDKHVVSANVQFKGRSLKGMGCKILSNLPKSKIFVELDENVGGASGDGLGKKGHCVVLRKENVCAKPREKSKEEKIF